MPKSCLPERHGFADPVEDLVKKRRSNLEIIHVTHFTNTKIAPAAVQKTVDALKEINKTLRLLSYERNEILAFVTGKLARPVKSVSETQ